MQYDILSLLLEFRYAYKFMSSLSSPNLVTKYSVQNVLNAVVFLLVLYFCYYL